MGFSSNCRQSQTAAVIFAGQRILTLELMPVDNLITFTRGNDMSATGKQRGILLGLSTITLLLFTSTVCGQSWFDNFDDGSFDDGDPVTWDINPLGALPGEYNTADGDFIMLALNGDDDNESLAAWVDAVDFNNTASVRTRASLLAIPDVIDGFGNVGVVLFFDPETISGYLGLMSVDTNLQLIQVDGGVATGLVSMDQPFSPSEDVIIQLDHDGENLYLTAWEIGAPKPSPQLEFELEQVDYTSGKSGLLFNENAPNDAGVFRWARASSDPIIDGDLNFDGEFNATDIDEMFDNLGSDDPLYDLNGDGDADNADVDFLVETSINTFYGDANVDGRVDAADLNAVGLNWRDDISGWANGDFNGDNTVDAADLNVLGLNWQSGVPVAASPIPEPASMGLLLFGIIGIAMRYRG